MKNENNLSAKTLRAKIKSISSDMEKTDQMIREWTDSEKSKFHSMQSARARKIQRLTEILRHRGEPAH